MGRELRRVPTDFNWPLHKVWEGFLNPHWRKCDACEAGHSRAYDLLHGHISKLVWDRHVTDDPHLKVITTYLCGRPPRGVIFGHDSIDSYAATMKLGELAGLPEDWGQCPTCKGVGCHPATAEAYEAWESTPPPTGDGWQVWETVSEGSPISPVFGTQAELVDWLVSEGYTRGAAQKFARSGYAPSMILDGRQIYHDIESASLQAEGQE